MPAHFNIRLDTTAPQGAVLELAGGAATVASKSVPVSLTTTDPDTTGYQIKLWGDVDLSFNPSIQDTEGASAWLDYGTITTLDLSDLDGLKTVYGKIRDDVGNETAILSDSVTFDSSVPVVTITVDPDLVKISKVTPWDKSNFTFMVNQDIDHYEIRVVPDPAATHDQGLLYSELDVALAADTPTPEVIDGTQLQTVVGPDGDYTIKVFARMAATGTWSV